MSTQEKYLVKLAEIAKSKNWGKDLEDVQVLVSSAMEAVVGLVAANASYKSSTTTTVTEVDLPKGPRFRVQKITDHLWKVEDMFVQGSLSFDSKDEAHEWLDNFRPFWRKPSSYQKFPLEQWKLPSGEDLETL